LFGSLSQENRKAFYHLLVFLIAIYCAAILGDYLSEALVIKHLTVNALPGLYQLNAAFLFVVTFIMFLFVDRVHRWQLVRVLSVSYAVLVAGCGLLTRWYGWSSVVLYSLSYISKLSLFSIFWIIANDICDTRKSKSLFPLIAGGGLLGGLVSTIISDKVVHYIHTENLIWLWAAMLIVPFFLVNRLVREFGFKLNAPDKTQLQSQTSDESLSIFSEKAVVIMAGVYFLVFILVFNIDFIFTRELSKKFYLSGQFNSDGFLSFKFSIYLIITLLIIVFQFTYTSDISKRIGVTNSMLVLPIVMFLGSMGLYALHVRALDIMFAFVIVFYILRQFLFESLFSSNYQIFFSAFSRKFRGRGKLILEGIVKPLAIASAGLLLMAKLDLSVHALVLAGCSLAMAILVIKLKKEYRIILLKEEFEAQKDDLRTMIKREISGKNNKKILSLILQAFDTQDFDLKRVVIKYLEYSGSHAAFELLRNKFFEESDRIKEIIARSLSTFDSVEVRGFLRNLLEEQNPVIRAGTIRSIRTNPYIDKGSYSLTRFIYDNDSLVFEEVVRLLYPALNADEKEVVHAKIAALLDSERMDEKCPGIRLIGHLKLSSFSSRLEKIIHSQTKEFWYAAVNALLQFDNERSIVSLVSFLEQNRDRAKERAIVEGLSRVNFRFYPIFEGLFLSTERKRIAFSLIDVMKLLSLRKLREKNAPVRQSDEVKNKLVAMAMDEMRSIYLDAYRYYDIAVQATLRSAVSDIRKTQKMIDLLKTAVTEKRKRFSMFVFDMLSLLDPSGALLTIERDFKLLDERKKANIIELIEAFGDRTIGRYLIPILEGYGERELLKIGSYRWKNEPGSFSTAIRYFEALDNRWISWIALYIEHKVYKNAA